MKFLPSPMKWVLCALSMSAYANELSMPLKNNDTNAVMAIIRTNKTLINTVCDGTYPLHIAIRNKQKDMTSLLLHFGADANQRDEMGDLPIGESAYRGDLHLVLMLITNRADVNGTGAFHFTALHKAACSGHDGICSVLIANGGKVDSKSDNGWTPLVSAVLNGHVSTSTVLIKAGADVNSSDKSGMTPLHWAAFMGQSEMVSLLITNGAQMKRNGKGESPLDVARKCNHTEILQLLAPNKKRESKPK